jgi:hypothetical protein
MMDAGQIRTALVNAIPIDNVGVPPLQYLYVPRSHARALHPDHPLVRGIRGAGKSLWWEVMQSRRYAALLRDFFPGRAPRQIRVTAGFGVSPAPDHYPGKDNLTALLARYDPRLIWRTIIFHQTAAVSIREWPDTWSKRLAWLSAHPEEVERALSSEDLRARTAETMLLLVFDALDLTADTWDARARLLDGLLRNLQEFRAYQGIRLKAFVRPDMLIGPEIGRFPDASKLMSSAVELDWPRTELFGLLWQYLSNAPQGSEAFRRSCQLDFRQRFQTAGEVWLAPAAMNTDEKVQRRIFEAIAGQWMGRDRRRGFPYTWLPSHLMDVHRQTSPRSFLAALRTAAEESERRYREHPHALHYEAIKRGVQQASRIRVREVAEDFDWLEEVMQPLKDLKVPCELSEIIERWQQVRLEVRLGKQLRGVLPRPSGAFAEGLCEQLREIGIFEFTSAGRINLPDVYRVGFGLRRMGGVKPLR